MFARLFTFQRILFGHSIKINHINYYSSSFGIDFISMTLNEEEIPSVSDKSPISAKQHKINRKRSVRDILIDFPPISSKYTPIRVENRPFVPLVENDSRNPLGLFRLFITRQHCRIIANHTNIKANNYMEKEKENNHRVWTDTTDSEIEIFLGILILMGLDHLPATEDYWNQRPDKPVIMPILSAMSLGRFQQIKRFLKINNGQTEPIGLGQGPDWWKKLEPLATDFRKTSLKHCRPGSMISIDEQLVLFKGRSRHTLQITTKSAHKGFKIYSLCQDNYLLSFMFASKSSRISELKTVRQLGFLPKDKLTPSALLVIQLCKELPSSLNYHLFCDNFFTSTKLFKALRSIGIAASGTAKKGSGFPEELLAIRDVTSKGKDWGLQAHMVVDDKVLCMGWVANNGVQYMTTGHSPQDLYEMHYINPHKRYGIPETSLQPIVSYFPSTLAHSIPLLNQEVQRPLGLPIPAPIKEYNLHMGGSDGNAQQRAIYSYNRRTDRYWWPLFIFILDAAGLNAYKLYSLNSFDSEEIKFTRSEFLRRIALELISNQAGIRPGSSKISINTTIDALVPSPIHHYVRLEGRKRCVQCNAEKKRPSKRKGEPLAEISVDGRKRRRRGAQTIWACGGCNPIRPCCKKASCWEAIHMIGDE